ncbi:hypothetical protein [Salipaludibacillus aurantiacus]|uniref:Uncharacterized protein n=1 Tax=Salipaludibacillus aurantiacus TaxID=1601833 RepID=A0A1H9QBP8_9BACI|nr:hypothetical protein [Salipaludibacillus aurantiacus]SER57585.1 hypothetical protein SAMN05518684_102121 [Salipaludibacillus aurantiacus]
MTIMRLTVNGGWDKIIWEEYEDYTDFVSDDYVTIYGEVWGAHNYTSQSG